MQRYGGTWTALITPFDASGEVDFAALRRLVRRQVEAGVTGISPVGTTGESPTTTADEDRRIIEAVVEAADGEAMVMAGTGSNVTLHAMEYTRAAKAAGADCCMVVSPYYNKPTPSGLVMHYEAVADEGLPVIVYNIKGRTGSNVETDTLMRIAEHEMVAGVKEASGDPEQMREVLRARPDGFTVLSGDDALTLELMEMGGDGVVSVCANIAPGEVAAMVRAALDGDWDAARRGARELGELFETLFIETNPVPVKYCAHRLGLCELVYRLPMCAPEDGSRAALDRLLERYGFAK